MLTLTRTPAAHASATPTINVAPALTRSSAFHALVDERAAARGERGAVFVVAAVLREWGTLFKALADTDEPCMMECS